MAKKNYKAQIAQEISSKIQEQQTKNFTFSFNYFEFDSLKSGEIKEFNNNFRDQGHFLKVNRCLYEAMKYLSNESYKSAIIDRKLENTMHCKVLDREESIDRIQSILIEGYDKSENLINQWEESKYIEFGITDEERFIAILIDYNIISILYMDPNHLTFPNYKFDIPLKMSYTTPSFLTRSSTTKVGLQIGLNNISDYEEYYNTIEMTKDLIKEYNEGKVQDDDIYEFLKEIYGGKRDD